MTNPINNEIPLVTVVTATFNMGYFLIEAIKGIQNQTLSSWEMIIIDDGSTDNTQSILRTVKDNRIRWLSTPNKGRASARNEALKIARGRYIAINDADDISLPERLEKQVLYLEQNPNVGVVSGQTLHFTNRNRPKKVVTYPTDKTEIKHYFTRGIMGISHAAAMIRKDVFDNIGEYCPECLRAQDLEILLRMSDVCNFANLNENVLLYRNDPSSTKYNFWIRLHLYHHYANYRYKTLRSEKSPVSFAQWRARATPWITVLTWDTLRFLKTKFTSYWLIRKG